MAFDDFQTTRAIFLVSSDTIAAAAVIVETSRALRNCYVGYGTRNERARVEILTMLRTIAMRFPVPGRDEVKVKVGL